MNSCVTALLRDIQEAGPISVLGMLGKKWISAALYPLGISLLVLFVGAILLRRKPPSRYSLIITLGAILWLLFMSFPISGHLLLRPLEAQAGDYADVSILAWMKPEYIVVLGATSVTGDLSAADRWSGEGLLRLMEGVRLWHGIPESKLVLSAGSCPGRRSSSVAMETLPTKLGIPKESLILETRASDTLDEAILFSQLVGKNKPFALVTSAMHMPRSVEIFRSLGMKPLACPCAFKTKVLPVWYNWFVPDASGLQNSHFAIHEYLGRAWLTLRDIF